MENRKKRNTLREYLKRRIDEEKENLYRIITEVEGVERAYR